MQQEEKKRPYDEQYTLCSRRRRKGLRMSRICTRSRRRSKGHRMSRICSRLSRKGCRLSRIGCRLSSGGLHDEQDRLEDEQDMRNDQDRLHGKIKGTVSRDFASGFFHESVSSQSQSIPL
jgi:hypothetical protein